jgi:hypothetical protein
MIGVEKSWSEKLPSAIFEIYWNRRAAMEWVVKLEARSGWGEVETIEVRTITRRVVG